MKVLVTGCTGQLGFDVCRQLKEKNIEYYGAVRDDFDLRNQAAIVSFIEKIKPDAVIHCAAYTAVDKAEDEPELCRQINVTATRTIAEICKTINAKMLYISTDYVFTGTGDHFQEVNDKKIAVNVYGQSKLDGESAVRNTLKNHFIVRVSWVFGIKGHNFIRTMLNLAQNHSTLRVVNDQIGSPTYTADLAVLLCNMVLSNKYGTYHATNEGICSWKDFAEEIFRQAAVNTAVIGQLSAEYPTKARRPLNSRLSKKSLDDAGFRRLPDWHDALQRYLKEINLEK
ncbi:dTDP-4-dehydrorhamnose reductase [Pectinatus haikarae]|uniref:dTDP-4-dehydrorhamnose reductase n=1 Tax=Pectinatus haikarae TaxID=349096 RepID=A0ABT9Y688_9FIRM|nr:dTDP-4-dehydrorhamnose reductase [Pectinatus haikarae]MDQ0202664.1 dTDP-4-dehydrorhamnose reductase [Pectinatus haikarae]